MKKEAWKDSLFGAIINIALLTLVIVVVIYFFINKKVMIGPVLIVLGLMSLLPAILFKIPMRTLKPDIIFGIVDNGVLVIFALIGAELFGIFGAILGGAVGNALTDGFAGLFEGYEVQKMKKFKIKDNRTALSVATGKLAGCLISVGVILIITWSIFKIF